ncbi:MAG TPA: AAA family ATPase [Thermoanaerobaculia bacterium]|nr:AAA family ATPase [Thermoanaerobaculia bacterium]
MATVVVLNGTSSSGKTTIARAFQELALPRTFLNFSIDSILYTLPPSVVSRLEAGSPAPINLVPAFYACVRELASLGHDLVIDHAITSRAEADLLLAAVASHRVLLVGLDCPLDVLAARERARGNRRVGMAAAQCERVHRWLEYDLRIDSGRVEAGEGAGMIAAAL